MHIDPKNIKGEKEPKKKRVNGKVVKLPFRNFIQKYKQQNELRRDYEFMPSTIEVLDRPPAPFARVMMLFIVLFAAFVLFWGWFAKMDIVVSAMGVVIPKGKVKVVQPLQSGVVTEIHVHDGQVVQEGDALVSMDHTQTLVDLKTLEDDLYETEINLSRLNAQLLHDASQFFFDGEDEKQLILLQRQLLEQALAAHEEKQDTLEHEIQRCRAEREVIQSNVSRIKQSLPISQQLYAKKKGLAQKNLIPNVELLQAEIDISNARFELQTAETQLREVQARLNRAKEEKTLVNSEYQRDILQQITEAKSRKANLHQQIIKIESVQSQYELTAPANGIVQQLAVNNVGAVVTAGQPLLVIVPMDNGLEVEAKVLNKDIGLITKDQDVSVKVTAYNFTRYGDLDGRIDWVASDAVIDQDVGPSYPIRVTLNKYELPNIVNGRKGVITPGMVVSADVKVGSRRVIQYFLGPILRYRDKSLREY